jgi:hypothetical protein
MDTYKTHESFFKSFYRYLHESGAALATRALGYGTLYAFAGCGVLFFSGSLIGKKLIFLFFFVPVSSVIF